MYITKWRRKRIPHLPSSTFWTNKKNWNRSHGNKRRRKRLTYGNIGLNRHLAWWVQDKTCMYQGMMKKKKTPKIHPLSTPCLPPFGCRATLKGGDFLMIILYKQFYTCLSNYLTSWAGPGLFNWPFSINRRMNLIAIPPVPPFLHCHHLDQHGGLRLLSIYPHGVLSLSPCFHFQDHMQPLLCSILTLSTYHNNLKNVNRT